MKTVVNFYAFDVTTTCGVVEIWFCVELAGLACCDVESECEGWLSWALNVFVWGSEFKECM